MHTPLQVSCSSTTSQHSPLPMMSFITSPTPAPCASISLPYGQAGYPLTHAPNFTLSRLPYLFPHSTVPPLHLLCGFWSSYSCPTIMCYWCVWCVWSFPGASCCGAATVKDCVCFFFKVPAVSAALCFHPCLRVCNPLKGSKRNCLSPLQNPCSQLSKRAGHPCMLYAKHIHER